ncbi:hypothetical protein BZG36_03659 [Bifiguratus adelaidae]|uniref:Uncharacterized protein n=1 Tax=Bifiguratus adelaidae TaxID=1938954 RepID=A0A261XW57_9FUNG|nr:hypothetical protein BZG36_03659 [Bifiguratus adelaidae]
MAALASPDYPHVQGSIDGRQPASLPSAEYIEDDEDVAQAYLAQIRDMIDQYDEQNHGTILSRDLIATVEDFQRRTTVQLFTPAQQKMIRPYLNSNADLELTAEDILQILALAANSNVGTIPNDEHSVPDDTMDTTRYDDEHIETLSPTDNSFYDRIPPVDSPSPLQQRRQSLPQRTAPLYVSEKWRPRRPFATTEPDIDEVDAENDDVQARADYDDYRNDVNTRIYSSSDFPLSRSLEKNVLSAEDDGSGQQRSQNDVSKWLQKSQDGYKHYAEDDEYDGRLSSRSADLQELQETADELARRLQESQEKALKSSQEYEEQIAQLEDNLENAKHEMLEKYKLIADFRGKQHELLTQINELEAEADKLRDIHSEQHDTISQLRQKVEAKSAEVSALQNDLDQVQTELLMVEEKLELSTKECMNLQEERDRLEAHRHERMLSQNEINEVSLELEAQRAESLRLQGLLADMRRELKEAPIALVPELSLSAVGDNMAPHKHTLQAELELAAKPDDMVEQHIHTSDRWTSDNDKPWSSATPEQAADEPLAFLLYTILMYAFGVISGIVLETIVRRLASQDLDYLDDGLQPLGSRTLQSIYWWLEQSLLDTPFKAVPL